MIYFLLMFIPCLSYNEYEYDKNFLNLILHYNEVIWLVGSIDKLVIKRAAKVSKILHTKVARLLIKFRG